MCTILYICLPLNNSLLPTLLSIFFVFLLLLIPIFTVWKVMRYSLDRFPVDFPLKLIPYHIGILPLVISSITKGGLVCGNVRLACSTLFEHVGHHCSKPGMGSYLA